MKKTIVFLLSLALILGSCLAKSARKVDDCMGMKFAANNDYIEFANSPSMDGIHQQLWMAWVKLNSAGQSSPGPQYNGSISGKLLGGGISSTSYPTYTTPFTDVFSYSKSLATTGGLWVTPDNSLVVGTIQHFAAFYDDTSVLNDPTLWVNGISVAVREIITPSGSPADDSGTDMTVGGSSEYSEYSVDGIVYSTVELNVSGLSAARIASIVTDAYNSRRVHPVQQAIVFDPDLCSSAGIQSFDGATLAAGNTITDIVSGALGTPSGSPLGVADTVLNFDE